MKKRKILSVLLTVIITVTMIPILAFASDDPDTGWYEFAKYKYKGNFKYDSSYGEGYYPVCYAKGTKVTIDENDFLNTSLIDRFIISKKDPKTGEYIPCYSKILEKHLKYKWSAKNGKIIGKKNKSKILIKPNDKTICTCSLYFYGTKLYDMQYRFESVEPVKFKGVEREKTIWITSEDQEVNLKLVEMKKGAIPKDAVFQYIRKEDLEDETGFVGKKTSSPYAKASLKGICDVKGEAVYVCNVFKNKKATKPLYIIDACVLLEETYPEIKLGESKQANLTEENHYCSSWTFTAEKSGNHIVSFDKPIHDNYIMESPGQNSLCYRPAYDNPYEFVIYAKKGNKYSISTFLAEYKPDTITTHIEMCKHAETEKVGYKAPTKKTKGFSGDIVCKKCGKIIKAGKAIKFSDVAKYEDDYAANDGVAKYLYYRVQPGDTLKSIAEYLKVDQSTLISLNNIKNPDLIYPGQSLKYPAK